MATIFAIRGANADLNNRLTQKGVEQVYELRTTLASVSITRFNRVIASTEDRAVETAARVSGWDRDLIPRVPQLWTPNSPEGNLMKAMFERSDNVSLSELFREYGNHAKEIFSRFGEVGRRIVCSHFFGPVGLGIGTDEFGLLTSDMAHIQAIVWIACDSDSIELVLGTNLKECEGFVLETEDCSQARVQLIGEYVRDHFTASAS